MAAFYGISRVTIKIPQHCFALFVNKLHVGAPHNTMCSAIYATVFPETTFLPSLFAFPMVQEADGCSARLPPWKQFSACLLWGCVRGCRALQPFPWAVLPGCFLLFGQATSIQPCSLLGLPCPSDSSTAGAAPDTKSAAHFHENIVKLSTALSTDSWKHHKRRETPAQGPTSKILVQAAGHAGAVVHLEWWAPDYFKHIS